MRKKRNAPVGGRGASEISSGQNYPANNQIAVRTQEPRGRLPDLWTCSGQEEIGRYYRGADGFGAFDGLGRYLGSFTTLTAARAAVWDARCEALTPMRRAA